MTAFTSGREIISRLLVEYTSAWVRSASARAASLLMSDTARKCTAGCFAARRALRLPIRPEPMTATPSSLRFLAAPSSVYTVKQSLTTKDTKDTKESFFENLRCEHPAIYRCIQAWKRELTVRRVTFESFASFVVKLCLPSVLRVLRGKALRHQNP